LLKKFKMTQKQKQKYNLSKILRQRRKELFGKVLNLKVANTLILFSFLILGVSYVAVKNDLSIKGLVITDLKSEIRILEKKNKDLGMEAMTTESYVKISERVNNLEMVKIAEISYLDSNKSVVAKR